jgi:ribosomal protein S18 acetylase RimI-like enzyme
MNGKEDNHLNEPIRLASSQREQAVAVLTRAFQEDPMYSYLFPDLDERIRSLGRLWNGVVRYSLVYGEVYTTPVLVGVACWLSPGNTRVTTWRTARTGFELQRAVLRFNREARRRVLELLTYTDQIHSQVMTRSHWYLMALGVEPTRQRQGLGSRLLQPVLARADRDGIPCYLETETEQNVAFYQKYGFQIAYEGEVADAGLTLWTMVREPGLYARIITQTQFHEPHRISQPGCA